MTSRYITRFVIELSAVNFERAEAEGRMSPGMAACVQKADDSEVVAQTKRRMVAVVSPDALAWADAYYASAAAQTSLQEAVFTRRGELGLPGQAPAAMTDDERAQVAAFNEDPRGEQLQAAMAGPDGKGHSDIHGALRALFETCRR